MQTANQTRRTFVAAGAALTAGTVAACVAAPAAKSAYAAEGQVPAPESLPDGIIEADFEVSAVEREPITDFAAEETYDIVVVSAGTSGVTSVATAIDEGATVCCLQKEDHVYSQGSGISAVIKGKSTKAGLARWRSRWMQVNDWRVNPELFDYYIDHSEESVSFIVKKGLEVGSEPTEHTTSSGVVFPNGEVAATFWVRTPSNQTHMTAIAEQCEQQGAVFHYSTPAVQLVQDADGTVTGVIGKTAEGDYIKVNATKGVILCAGDYMNNTSMLKRYNGDTLDLYPDVVNETGDGHILGTLAGGRIAPAPHPRQIHSAWSTDGLLLDTPLLALDTAGKRFMNEECVMTEWNTILKYHYPFGEPEFLYRIVDSAIEDKYPGTATIADMERVVGETNPDIPFGYGRAVFKADTIEELCALMKIEDAQVVESVKQSIARYNELCAAGVDEDFGKAGEFLQTIDTPPFYGIVNNPESNSADNGGLLVDAHYQVVDVNKNPIPHLFAAGVDAGDLCGGINWKMPRGSSNGHCINAGRYTVIYALTGDLVPSNPCSFDDVASLCAEEDGTFMWDKPENARTDIMVW